MYKKFGIQDKIINLASEVEEELKTQFEKVDKIKEENSLKVLMAFQKYNLSDMHFGMTTGYGYGDVGRDIIEKIFAEVLGAEDSLVRNQFISGTHALTVALFSMLRPGDTMLSINGKPYDTLDRVIGIEENASSLKSYGVKYEQIDLIGNEFDTEKIVNRVGQGNVKLICMQRSRGYALRKSLSLESIKNIISKIREGNKEAIIMVDNCYGELVDTIEPTSLGADLIVGSLIKNLGGGLAPNGAYIAGRKDCIEQAAYRLSSPGLGKEVGATIGVNKDFYQGLFLAPTVVAGALKGAVFAANVYEKAGFKCVPDATEERYDIIQAVELKSEEGLIAFCKGIQAAAPVDSFVTPEPWAMPGYDSDVIMAAGAFVQGSSIELSADGPVKEPYAVYFQGGLTWYHAKLGIMMSMQKMYEKGLLKI